MEDSCLEQREKIQKHCELWGLQCPNFDSTSELINCVAILLAVDNTNAPPSSRERHTVPGLERKLESCNAECESLRQEIRKFKIRQAQREAHQLLRDIQNIACVSEREIS